MPAAPGMLSKLGGAVGKVGQVGKLFPGGALLESGAMAFDTFQNAETQDEKAEGYGAAAGSLAGTMAGAAAGAAIGSVVVCGCTIALISRTHKGEPLPDEEPLITPTPVVGGR